MLFEGKIVDQDIDGAIKIFDEVCLKNGSRSCNNLGIIYAEGKVVKADSEKAYHYFEKACNLDNKDGCSNLEILKKEISDN